MLPSSQYHLGTRREDYPCWIVTMIDKHEMESGTSFTHQSTTIYISRRTKSPQSNQSHPLYSQEPDCAWISIPIGTAKEKEPAAQPIRSVYDVSYTCVSQHVLFVWFATSFYMDAFRTLNHKGATPIASSFKKTLMKDKTGATGVFLELPYN